jgi:transcription initiation factor TFIIH subunit 4
MSTPSPTKKRRKKAKALQTNGLLDYLQSALPKEKLQELFVDAHLGQFVVKAVLQQIPPTAQQIVVRLRCTGGKFPAKLVKVWLNTKEHQHIIAAMDKWGILETRSATAFDESSGNLELSKRFFEGLCAALCNLNSSPWTPIDIQQQPIEIRESIKISGDVLEKHTQERWDAVLHFLVGSSGHPAPPLAMVNFLLETGLMQPDPEYRGKNKDEAMLVITESGYDFMLQDVQHQVWHFVAQYLYTVERHDKEQGTDRRKHALLFLLSLCFAKVGEPYSTSSLSKEYRGTEYEGDVVSEPSALISFLEVFIKDLSHFGLVYTKKVAKSTVFYPTRIASQLAGISSKTTVYSLSTKALEASIADPSPKESSHFTRDAVKSAFNLGITAKQILKFLEKHAHPKLRVPGESPLPPNVVDQIWLWDREMSRVVFRKVYQHECLLGQSEFEAVLEEAKRTHAHVWSSSGRQRLLLSYDQLEKMQKFVQEWRTKNIDR